MRAAFLVILGLVATASAQPTGLYLTGSFSQTQFDGDRLAELGETYSAAFADVLDAPVDFLPGEAAHPAFGVAGRISDGRLGAGFTFQIGRATSDQASQFSNGRGNRVRGRTLDHVATLDVTAQFGPAVLGVSAGGMFRGVRVEVATTYPDGAESIGSEFRFNGVYTGSSTYLEGGVLAGLVLADRVFIPVRLVFPVEIAATGLPVQDYDVSQVGTNFLPRDFERYLANPTALDDDAAVSVDDYVGPRLQVGIEIRLL